MYTVSYLKYLLSDDTSLQSYYVKRKAVTLDDVKRSLMLIERENDRHIPDHYYRLGQERSFAGIHSLSELFTIGLRRLADDYLELRNDRIYVKADKMNDWQMMLPYMPPLLMECILLWEHYPLENCHEVDYIKDHLLPNVSFTAYPSPYIPQMEDFLDNGGMTDLHMHLNGALETDLAWQDFLNNPLEIKKELEVAYGDFKVKEQYEQSSFLADPEKFYHLLRVASTLRILLFNYAYVVEVEEEKLDGSFEEMLQRIANEKLFSGTWTKHPLEQIVGEKVKPQFMEGVLYVKVLQEMSLQPENDVLSGLFHYYLLILGLVNKMMVQQPTSYGFEEFQKITLNGLREYSEKQDYSKRFAQLSGNQLRNIRLLEGRFSPKDSTNKNEVLIGNILDGWEMLCQQQMAESIKMSELELVAHFIKKADKKPDNQIRHKAFREDIDHRADLLIEQKRSNTRLSKAVLGIDAAASEFDTPPEVFAPVYRKLRKAGFHHFTYHAGEDFFHILSGLRAIYEAIIYLDLQRCDRIGHATAAGVPVQLWHRNIGDRMLIRQGEHLDNLIFAYYFISRNGDSDLKNILPMLALKIDEYSYEVYQRYYPVSIHMQAWRERYRNPLKEFSRGKVTGEGNTPDDIFMVYHAKETYERYNKIIEIGTLDVMNEQQLTDLQLLLLKEMHQREIVIETLPTSNVIIGNHHDYSTYHLYNWYLWKEQGYPLPPIVVGTDDVGIFATNIYNEYCNIYCQFLYTKNRNSDEILRFLREIDYNARHYAFVD